ncbi:hypothetical protein MOF34_15445 [Bacillus sp. T17B1]|uniref:hypothetical protein n=1 Tax=Bacillus sp. T17B1 TaxID=2918911 RepID=UPI002282EEF0|nr:hypothetical protein [Bacillus sp. T17B1]
MWARIRQQLSFWNISLRLFSYILRFNGYRKTKTKKLKILLYFMGIFAIIVMPHLPIDTINDLGAYTNFYSLVGLGAVIAFLPQKIKEVKLKDKRIRELETEIAEMKKSNLKSE